MKILTAVDRCPTSYSGLRLGIVSARKVLSSALVVGLASLLITGCTDKHKPATQVVAKVNNDEISVHQVNNALAQIPHLAPEDTDKARQDVLAKLVNQQLAVQQAISQKLDRTPEVMMQIDAANREILTRAYLSRLVAGLTKPSAEDAKKFYDTHPELFAQRRIYNLQQISIPNPHPAIADLQKMIAGKSMAETEAGLKAQNIVYTSNSGTRAAEQIALPMLTELAKLQDGQTSIMETPQLAMIVHIEASQLAPVSEDLAMQRIPQYLMNEQAKIAINDNIEHLKSKSKIEYMNEFGSNAKPPESLAMPVADTSKTTNSVERGIKGIN